MLSDFHRMSTRDFLYCRRTCNMCYKNRGWWDACHHQGHPNFLSEEMHSTSTCHPPDHQLALCLYRQEEEQLLHCCFACHYLHNVSPMVSSTDKKLRIVLKVCIPAITGNWHLLAQHIASNIPPSVTTCVTIKFISADAMSLPHTVWMWGLIADYVLSVHLSQIILKVFTYNHQGLSIDTVLNQPE